MKDEQILNCSVCGKEVRFVRLGRSLLTLGHRSNPGPNHHRVEIRPAPSSADGRTEGFEGIRRQSGVLGRTPRRTARATERPKRDAARMPNGRTRTADNPPG